MSKKGSSSKSKKTVVVYTDGSCSGNGRDDSVGGIGIHFPNEELDDISKVFDLGNVTNQRTELYAILIALRYINKNIGLENCRVLIKSDSKYSIDCVTKWVKNWVKNGWKTKEGKPVMNREFIEPIYKYVSTYDIIFEHVSAHTNGDDEDSLANAIADDLATKATKRANSNQHTSVIPKQSRSVPFQPARFAKPSVRKSSTMIDGLPWGENMIVELVDEHLKK